MQLLHDELVVTFMTIDETNAHHTNNVELEFFQGLIMVIVMRNLCVSSAKVRQVYEFYNNQV
jgi:hypothetical protein